MFAIPMTEWWCMVTLTRMLHTNGQERTLQEWNKEIDRVIFGNQLTDSEKQLSSLDGLRSSSRQSQHRHIYWTFCKKAQNCSTNCQINVDSRNNKRWTSRASHRSTCVVFGSTNLRGWARCVVASSLTVGLADCINAPQTDWLVRTRRWRYTVIRSQ